MKLLIEWIKSFEDLKPFCKLYSVFCQARQNNTQIENWIQSSYYHQPLIQPPNDPRLDGRLSQILSATSKIALEFRKTFEELSNVFQEKLLPMLKNALSYEQLNKLAKIRSQYSIQSEDLNELVEVVSYRCARLSETFHKEKRESASAVKIDMYARQQSFISAAFHQTEAQKRMGHLASQYLSGAIENEKKQNKIINEVLKIYYKFQLLLNPTLPDKYLQELQIENTEKLVEQTIYNPQSFINQATKNKLKESCLTANEITIEFLDRFLKQLHFEDPPLRQLILKEWEASINDISVTIRLTVDAFLHLYQGNSIAKHKATHFCKVNNSLQIKQIDEQSVLLSFVNIYDKEAGKVKLTMVFPSSDSLIQFQQFVDSVLQH